MMTRKELLDLSKLVKAAYRDCAILTIEEIEQLESTLQTELHIQQAHDFRQHVHKLDRIEVNPHGDGSELDRLYELDWQISIDGKSMTLHNSAGMMTQFINLIDEYIEYEL